METSQRKSLKTLRFSEQCRNVFYDEDGVLSSEWGAIRYRLKSVKDVKGPCFRLESSGKESPLARQPSLWRHASGTSLERA